MSLFDRLLEQQLKPKPTFTEKREQWLEEAHAKARGEVAPSPPPPPLRRGIEARNAELNALEVRAPQPTPPPPAPVNLSGPLVARGSCKAINPDTGRQCALLAGHTKLHRHGTTEFRFGAQPGQKNFTRRDALDRVASSRNASPFTTPQGD